MKLREAVSTDARMLFNWANDSSVRKHAFSPKPLVWENHKQWFEKKLKDAKSHIYIALLANGEAVGQIRFDLSDSAIAEVDVHTEPALTSQGIGSRLIVLGAERVFKQAEVREIHAIVKQENIKSCRAFQKAGFLMSDEIALQGHACFRFIALPKT